MVDDANKKKIHATPVAMSVIVVAAFATKI